MSDLLNIGASAIRAYSRSLAAVSDNIANSQTPGYARRSVRLQEAPSAGDVALYRNAVMPGGVLVDGINRSVNQWLVDDARTAGSETGQSGVRLAWLEATERALDDGPSGVGQSLTAMFNVADQLSSNPGSEALRQNFLQSVDDVASAFRRTADGLESVSQGIAAEANLKVDSLNNDLDALKRVNDGLASARVGSTNHAGLLDERDRILDRISQSVPIAAEYGGRGITTLRVDGPGHEPLVDGNYIATVSHGFAADGTLNYTIAGGATFTPPSGELAGLAQASRHLVTQQGELDTLAAQVTSDVNALHQSGVDAAGNPGQPLFNLASGAASMVAAAITPPGVAAADATSTNGNMLAFANLRGAAGAETNWAGLVALQSQAVASAQTQDAAATARQEGANAARDDVSSVDLDREAADLLRFQQAYQGAARVLQVARENMQTIMSSL